MPFVAFDLYGTLCTFEKIIDKIEETFSQQAFEMTPRLARQFFTFWYNIALRDYIATSQAGRYCPLLKVLKVTLTRALLCFSDDYEITATDVQIEAIMTAFDTIEPDTEALKALDMLVLEKWDIWVLSVGGTVDTTALLCRTGLDAYTSSNNMLCCDDLRISKPHPKVYSELMRMAVHKTQRIENFYMVGSYAFDLAGAKNVSFRTVFLNTSEKVYSAKMYDTGGPDITGASLVECVTKMIQFEKTGHFIQPILTRDAAITIENV
ncbi:HAD-like domain-containing protein [Mucor mucedo]|uniref:HAD-like domain-containing protein n=1 Tax=Mucor mucedo TaxID=29922 RepID=UPI0022207CD5|nr:HAD-like domain-containing protein [Mucor mucedo]KAI7893372.1 HAD-like domain-containing protein [Mucor mucedo]